MGEMEFAFDVIIGTCLFVAGYLLGRRMKEREYERDAHDLDL